jgi:hypothetical protein
MNLSVIDLGLIEYERAWRLQEKYATEIEEMSLADLLMNRLRRVKGRGHSRIRRGIWF